MTSLEPTHTVEEVAAALGEVPRYVQTMCREKRWPHLRGSRGRVTFTSEQYRQILELRAQAAADPEPTGLAWAPRSRRRTA